MTEERILITKCSGECRYLLLLKEPIEDLRPGYYCSAYPHGDWEKIEPKECDKCTREKSLTGIAREEAIERIAKALQNVAYSGNYTLDADYRHAEHFAEAALDALLGE